MGNMGCAVKKSPVLGFHDSKMWRAYFENNRNTDKLMVIEFSAPCEPCRKMEPIIFGLAVRYGDIQFININVDRLNDVAGEFGVEAIPTIVLMRSGKELERVVGTPHRDKLEKLIEKHKG